uniref:SAMP-activating enzyme E1 n=1 Tax=Candidatus Methanogaster sp. ANME-2c ERB4 TaxID=2759911 RepID=A0A7G9Y6E7_9EURY|nr:SAMP-activating enzyme E1 [Methanosarcinales archaeon ANME-2c ERB4]QNO43594.1 SAMP-activating enzyme E1 [Methanosarcinales archaeon ANME-2c ERB4]QNO44725.1 SAMP-activating enzyme E1 [Methanosarcinales archaeon ANME-2c ERB4]
MLTRERRERSERYERQIPLLGTDGQERIRDASVFIAGAGGLGSPTAIYLEAAGIDKIVIADFDRVDVSNLNRQILHRDGDVARMKADSARERLVKINPDVEIDVIAEKIDENNASELVGGSDLVVDAMDNFRARCLLNKAAIARNIPLFRGAVHRFVGQVTTVIPGETACLRCIFQNDPPEGVFPIIGATCGVVASVQVTEVLKYISCTGTLAANRLLFWNGADTTMSEIRVKQDLECVDCKGAGAN